MIAINDQELETVHGGNAWLAAAGAAIAIYDAASDFIEGFKEGYASGE